MEYETSKEKKKTTFLSFLLITALINECLMEVSYVDES